MLACWGMPIFEMLDLEALGEHCATTKRYTFFFSSLPLNGALAASVFRLLLTASTVIGGVSSPPCAQALF
jgi:hypothetical protein